MATILRMRFPDWRGKAFTLSYDDGLTSDFRLADLMRKNGIKGTFNVTSRFYDENFVDPVPMKRRRMKKSELLEFWAKNKDICEIAIHGATHPKYSDMPAPSVAWDVATNRHDLEELFGIVCRGCAYPNGGTNEEAINALKACGVAYARSTNREGFDLPENWLRFGGTCHHTDPDLMKLADEFLAFSTVGFREPSKWFYVWGHTYEFEDSGNWDLMENLLAKMGGHEEIWYATNIEIYDYVRAWKRLEFSADTRRVYNPSALPVWFDWYPSTPSKNPNHVVVTPGETKEL